MHQECRVQHLQFHQGACHRWYHRVLLHLLQLRLPRELPQVRRRDWHDTHQRSVRHQEKLADLLDEGGSQNHESFLGFHPALSSVLAQHVDHMTSPPALQLVRLNHEVRQEARHLLPSHLDDELHQMPQRLRS